MAKQRAKTKAAARKVAKPKAPAKGKTFTPFIQATRWPRDISLKKVVKRRDMGDITGLARSIDERGCLLQPVVIDKEDFLIAGQRRLAAWALSKKFHKQPIPVHVVDVDAILAGELDENVKRKDFTPSETVDMMEALLPIAKAAAKSRQAHGKTAPGKGKAAAADPDAGAAVDHLARYFGRDRKTLTKAQEVVEAARAEPEKFGDLVAVMDKSGKVSGPWNRLRVRRQTDDIKEKRASGKLDLPKGQHDLAVVDYAWPHEPGNESEDRATRPYKTMPIAEGMVLMRELGKRLAKNATVYFWTTSFHMQFAFTLLRAAGLVVPGDARKDAADPTKGAVCAPTILTWVKDSIGQGQRLREQSEHCIIAIKGNPLWKKDDLPSTVLRGASGENSEKPAEFYALIDELTPAERPIELFARRKMPEGWAGWGDQVGTLEPSAPPAQFINFGNINDGLLAVLGAIERGEPIDFNENDHVVRGLYSGTKKRKLTKAGRAKLAEVRKEHARREEVALTPEQKSERDRERLTAAAERAGHSIVITLEGDGDDDRKSVATCQCGWSSVALLTDGGQASQQISIADHQRSIAAVALRPEAEAKTAKRGSRRANRPPAPEGNLFNDHGVLGHTVRMHNEGGMARATCECGDFSCEYPSVNDREAAVQSHWAAVRGAGVPAAESANEAAE